MRLPLLLTFVLALAGCGPSNLEECRAAAVKLPTDAGVRMAAMDCQNKFGFDPSTAVPVK